MWTFLGLLVVAGVLAYWLRRIARVHSALSAVVEAGLNRAATNRGEPKISEDVDTKRIF